MELLDQEQQELELERKVIDAPPTIVENEVNQRTGEATGTWRGESVEVDEYRFAGSIDFGLDNGYVADSIKGRIAGFVDDAMAGMLEGDRDRGGQPLWEKLPDFHKENTIEVVIRIRSND